ncbi:hypothetical protein BACCAP_04576 [Pseudoflavonifractor capillosus ATCC 29799]|uniref:Uncharacterized protein n=1 Tax=Pseudoflavonifractor capillosus ATCC 29799 TaxID=411467 RepID=A6P248_9FIRM|nr:hypothetical protein BACCAP_04576 [Pseudoflavonifractor capillosus ATCC 29799]
MGPPPLRYPVVCFKLRLKRDILPLLFYGGYLLSYQFRADKSIPFPLFFYKFT